MKNININIPTFSKTENVLLTPGQFCFQLNQEDDIKMGKTNIISKKKVEEIKIKYSNGI